MNDQTILEDPPTPSGLQLASHPLNTRQVGEKQWATPAADGRVTVALCPWFWSFPGEENNRQHTDFCGARDAESGDRCRNDRHYVDVAERAAREGSHPQERMP